MSAVVDAAHAGRVRIHYRREQIRHHRNAYWTWVAIGAAAEPGS